MTAIPNEITYESHRKRYLDKHELFNLDRCFAYPHSVIYAFHLRFQILYLLEEEFY